MHSPAFDHLCACDPVLGAVVARLGPLEEHLPSGDPFASLCDIIIGQQLSGASARAIKNRFRAHFGEAPVAAQVLSMSDETAKTLGLSAQKARYLKNLAQHIEGGLLDIAHLETLSDEEIKREIVAVKGLGEWSADIFLLFHMGRSDVLPVGDLGIREAIKRLYGLHERPTREEMERLSAPWRPYRSLAARYLWRFLDEK